MQLMTNLTPEELRQGINLNRTWAYGWKPSLTDLSCGLFLVFDFCAQIPRAVEGNPIEVDMLILALGPISLLWLSWFRTSRAMEKSARMLCDLEATVFLDAAGIHVTTASGATSLWPWSDFSAWKEGPEVFSLTTGKTFRIFSKRGLGAEGEEAVRSLFRSHVS